MENAGKENRYSLSTKGVMLYVGLWGAIFGSFHILITYFIPAVQGTHTQQDYLACNCMLFFTLGLTFVGIGVTIAFLAGQIKHFVSVAACSFLVGLLSLPMLVVVGIFLAVLGFLEL